jgi:predicted nuclease of predicted toxin-antitoxin system
MKFLIDMNVSYVLCDDMAQLGLNAVHWSTVGLATEVDEVIFDYARSHEMVIVTRDIDFTNLLWARRASKPSVILLREGQLNGKALAQVLRQIATQFTDPLQAGALVTYSLKKSRCVILPL